jgi:TM2 domain-containing membrane protein YozV/type II secretory pathway pseudopilin PulG
MDSQRYNITFEGKIVDGVDMEIAKGNLQRLFKTDRATVDKLFSGKRTVLKKDVPAESVKKYLAALTNAGVECTTDPDLSSAAAPVAPGPSPAIAPAKQAAPAATPTPTKTPAEDSGPANPYAPPKQNTVVDQQVFCRSCGAKIDATASSCPQCNTRQLVGKPKSKVTAALLAIFLGFLGIHRFYLGQWVGIIYLLFGFIAWPVAWIEAIVFLLTDRDRWEKKYGNVVGVGAAMMIVAAVVFIAIIGILAAIAIPQYNDYVQRLKVSQSISAVQPVIDQVAEFGKREKYFPNSNTEAGLVDDLSDESLTSLVVSENGVITMTFGSDNNHLLDGKTLLYVPSLVDNTVQWDCSGGTLGKQLRPPQCRDGNYSGQQVAVNRQWVIADDNLTKMSVPTSWEEHPEFTEVAGIEYANLQREQYLVVISEPKTDFTSNTDVFGYNDLLQQNLRDSISNLQVKYLGEVQINGMNGLKYELKGEIDNLKIVYLQVALEGEDHFHQLLFWTLPSRWRSNLELFEEALVSFAECPGGCSGL